MRLRPYTTILPKPLLPIGDRPILEIILRQLAAAGFTKVDLCVGHLGELIRVYFSEGTVLPEGLELDWHWEPEEPLGTAGALRVVPGPRRHLPGHERRHPHDARLRRAGRPPPRARRRADDRRPGQARRDRPRRARARRRPRDRLPREADAQLRREHGHLRLRGARARAPARRAVPVPRARPAAAGRRRAASAPTAPRTRWFDLGTIAEYERAVAELDAAAARERLLGGPPGARDRAHRLQGRVAGAVAAPAGRRGDGLLGGAADHAVAVRGGARRRAGRRRARRRARRRRRSPTRSPRRGPRSSSTSRRRRSCARRSRIRPAPTRSTCSAPRTCSTRRATPRSSA